ncbi:hypothetical protein F4824DRAFT_471096 [Ustulina deusta]|nr:hypothetical protein F4824DRAFT_471096 [Ustulina deusta]
MCTPVISTLLLPTVLPYFCAMLTSAVLLTNVVRYTSSQSSPIQSIGAYLIPACVLPFAHSPPHALFQRADKEALNNVATSPCTILPQ